MEQKKELYREKSLQYISSPEQLNQYLKVTKPAVWAVLVAVVLLLAGLLIWSSFAYVISSVDGHAEVEDGMMVIDFYDNNKAASVKEGMMATVGDIEIELDAVTLDEYGCYFAVANTTLENGSYEVTVNYKRTQVIGLLLGD